MTSPPLICGSIVAPTTEAALAVMARAAPACDALELRLDAAAPGAFDLARLLSASPRPLVVTCRPPREGGGWRGSEAERLALLARAAALGAAFVDVEWDALADLPEVPARLIVSRHPQAEPAAAELPALLASLRSPRAAVQKLAVPCSDAALALRLLELARAEACPTVGIAMGFAGVVTRLAGALAGAPLLYAAADPQAPAAPGQLGATALRRLLAGRRLSRASALYGVAGRPVGHSRSPELHNAAFAALGEDAVYAWLETADLPALLAVAAAGERLRGLSVTLPHKQALVGHPRVRLDPLATAAGALNTLVRTEAGWTGHNTDALAAERLVGEALAAAGTPPARAPVALLGSGGAARALAQAFARLGAPVTVFARTAARGQALARAAGARWGGPLAAVTPGAFAVVANATSVGMDPRPDRSPVAPDALRPGALAYDLVYTPADTRFLREARARGARTIDGLAHFALQARAQLELWLGPERLEALPPAWFRERLSAPA